MKLIQMLLAGAVILASSVGAQAKDRFAVIQGDSSSANQFWAKVEKGAVSKAAEMGIDVVVLAQPGGEQDIAGQIAIVEDQLTKGITGLAIAPADPAALNPTIERALAQGVKVVYIDRPGGVEGITYVGTANRPAAATGAQYMCDHLEPGSNVAILQGVMSIVNGSDRYTGARETLEACGMNIVAVQTAEWDIAKGQSVTENILTAHPDLDAIFSSNDNMALGAIEALRGAKMLDQVMVVGFDGNPAAAEAILRGEMEISVAQRPSVMGALAIETLAKLVAGEEVPAVVDTGSLIVDVNNAEQFK